MIQAMKVEGPVAGEEDLTKLWNAVDKTQIQCARLKVALRREDEGNAPSPPLDHASSVYVDATATNVAASTESMRNSG